MEDRLKNQPPGREAGARSHPYSPVGDDRGSPLLRRLADVLLARQSVQRPTLARQTNLPLQVISDLLAELESRGLVVVNGRFNGIPGRSNLSYALAAGAAAALAVDLNENGIDVALCDLRGMVLVSERTPFIPGGPSLDDRLGTAIRRACERAGIERFRIGLARVKVDQAGMPRERLAALTAQLGCPVVLDDDTARTQPERLERARHDLLSLLFGDVS